MQYVNNPNLYAEIMGGNLVPKMQAGGLFGAGRYIDIDDKKLCKFPAIDPDPTWVYTNPNPGVPCLELKAIEKGFGFIPNKCLDCWKTVVAPRSFHELMQLLDLQEKMMKFDPKCWCKCGIEPRDYVPRNYGGYFYSRNKEDGQKRYKMVRGAVSKEISPDVSVHLKRYCTEFELRLGPSDKYVRPPGADELEEDFWKVVNAEKGALRQPDFIIRNVIQSWMVFAWGRGDMTVMLYNNGEPLFRPSVTYHKGEGE